MGSIGRFRWLWLAGFALASVATPARAQDADDQQRGVARISLMDGDVSVRRGDAAEWVAGVVNAPLMTDDRIATAPNSRAEVQFDAANVMRIGGNAEVHLAALEYGRYQIEIAKGTVTFVVLRPSSAKVEVDTPSVSVRPDKRGAYRIAVNEAGETQVIARSGEVEVFTPRGSEWVGAGKMLMARGTSADPEFQIVNAIPLDDWDNWNQSRDRALTEVTSYQYVPEGVYGAEELDSYGTWANVAPYGYVWRPTVAVADWAPYRRGRWTWEDWYGWSWVSYDPWGWAPYHYGRWFWDTGYGWCWYPGVMGRRHYWSPALVAWFGFGRGNVGFGFGHVGWVPLAPYETFHPWWGRGYYGRGFNQNINITNVNIVNNYRNARFGNGISGVGYNDFHSGRFNGISRFSGDQVREAGLIRGQMPVAPSRSHVQYSERVAGFVPQASRNTQFYSRSRVSTPQRIPFEQQRQAFGGNRQDSGARLGETPRQAAQSGNGWRQGSFENTRPAQAASPNRAPNRLENTRPQQSATPQATTPQNRSSWQRFGEPSTRSVAPNRFENTRPQQSAAPQSVPQSRGSWQRFGEPGSGNRTAPRTYQSPPSQGSGQRFGSGSGSVVRERPMPRTYEAPSAPQRGGFGGGSSPRYEAPRSMPSPRGSFGGGGGRSYSPPAPRSSGGGGGGFSAPRSSGGGGFGGSRSSGGGGGGRPSGGGGGGSRSGGHGRR